MKSNLFTCTKCNRCFDKESRLKRHEQRKTPCSKTYTSNNTLKPEKDKQQFYCEYCQTLFYSSYTLERHINNPSNGCFHQKKQEETIKEMKNMIQKQLSNNNKPSTVNNNITNNIIQFVLPGQETIGHITDTQFLEALDMDNFQDVLCELMRMTFFNKDAPENNHWCVAFLNGKYGVLQYNPKTERIERASTEKTIVLHFDNLFYSLGEKMDYFMNELTLTDNQIRNINIFYKYLGTTDPNPEEFNEIKMMAYNNRSIPIELWKSMGIEGEHKKIKL